MRLNRKVVARALAATFGAIMMLSAASPRSLDSPMSAITAISVLPEDVWFDLPNIAALGHLDSTGCTYLISAGTGGGAALRDLAVDTSGNPWFVNFKTGRLGVFSGTLHWITLPNARANSIAPFEDGVLVAPRSGGNVFIVSSKGTATISLGVASGTLGNVAADEDGSIYVQTMTGLRARDSAGTWSTYKLQSFSTALSGTQHGVWALEGAAHLLARVSQGHVTEFPIAHGDVVSLTSTDRYAYVGGTNAIYKYDDHGRLLQTIPVVDAFRIDSLALTADGTDLWFGSDNGLMGHFDSSGRRIDFSLSQRLLATIGTCRSVNLLPATEPT
jgi:streptogramin lyase